MYYKVEPSGCCERRGMIQVRYCFYLEPEDYGYDKRYVEVPIFPKEGYPGKVNEMGGPVDSESYETWIKSLPTEMVNTPFHNHFCLFAADVSDTEIHAKGKTFLGEAKLFWEKNEFPNIKNPKVSFTKAISAVCMSKIADINIKTFKGGL